MKLFLRTSIFGATGGIGILIVEVLLLIFLDRDSAIRHTVDCCFTMLSDPLEGLLKQTTLGRDLRQSQDLLKTILLLSLWWGVLGIFVAMLVRYGSTLISFWFRKHQHRINHGERRV
jgi:hypothetical protein